MQSGMSGRSTVTEYDGSSGSGPRPRVRRGGSTVTVAGWLQSAQGEPESKEITGR